MASSTQLASRRRWHDSHLCAVRSLGTPALCVPSPRERLLLNAAVPLHAPCTPNFRGAGRLTEAETRTSQFSQVDISQTNISRNTATGKFAGAAVAAGGVVVFAPHQADSIGCFDPMTNRFWAVDISGSVTGDAKFVGAVAVNLGALVVFAPNNALAAGLFHLTLPAPPFSPSPPLGPGGLQLSPPLSPPGPPRLLFEAPAAAIPPPPLPPHLSFATHDISEHIRRPRKFGGGAATSNNLVVFSPRDADGVGLFDALSLDFSLVAIDHLVPGQNRFAGAALASDGCVVFAPRDALVVGIFDPVARNFSVVDVGSSISSGAEQFSGAAAIDNLVIFAPYNAPGVGVYNVTARTFALVAIGASGGDARKYSAAVVVPATTKVVFAPFDAAAIGIFDISSLQFTTVDISATVTGGAKYGGGVALANGLIVFSPQNATNIGIFDAVHRGFSTVDASTGTGSRPAFSGVAASAGAIVFAPLACSTR